MANKDNTATESLSTRDDYTVAPGEGGGREWANTSQGSRGVSVSAATEGQPGRGLLEVE